MVFFLKECDQWGGLGFVGMAERGSTFLVDFHEGEDVFGGLE